MTDSKATSDRAAKLADRVLDAVIVNLQEFTTDELRAVIEYREEINPKCWAAQMLREYVECWR